MYIIVSKQNNAFLNFGEKLDHMSNGYPRLTKENVAYPDWAVNIFQVDEIPSEVILNKYCYTPEQGFYPNPNWIEPNQYGIPDELVKRIKADYREQITQEVAENDAQ